MGSGRSSSVAAVSPVVRLIPDVSACTCSSPGLSWGGGRDWSLPRTIRASVPSVKVALRPTLRVDSTAASRTSGSTS